MDTWTVARMLHWMEGYLGEHGDTDPKVSTRWLVSDALGLTKMQLYTELDRPLDQTELDRLRAYVKRRAAGEPLQYITGKTFFRHIDVKVGEGVLIPRPETEILVSEALSELPAYRYNVSDAEEAPEQPTLRIAEIGTGTGCVACSLAHEHPAVEVFASDISPYAVALARENAEALGLTDRVHIVECDLGSALEGLFDGIVSNPPYVPTDVLARIPREVTAYEPALALDGGADGLDAYRRIVDWSTRSLKRGGFLACELHETALDEAARIAENAGFGSVRIVKDLVGKPRVIVARHGEKEDA